MSVFLTGERERRLPGCNMAEHGLPMRYTELQSSCNQWRPFCMRAMRDAFAASDSRFGLPGFESLLPKYPHVTYNLCF